MDLAVRRLNASSLYVGIPWRCYIWSTRMNHMRGMIRKQRVDLTDDHATTQHCYDTFDYIKSLPLHLRV
jgi:hypothetical protein